LRALRKGICLLLLAVVVPTGPAVVARQTDEVSDLWLIRARSLTDELLKDADALGRYDRALLLARLGKVWQQSDSERAQVWIERAMQAVESSTDKGDAAEYAKRASAARSLLVILGAQDKALSARLNKVINDATEAAALADIRENARAKAEAGLAVVESDPQRALQFGLASLRAGGSYRLSSLLWRLRKRDANLSETLFTEVVAAARARGYDPDLLNILPVVTFEGPAPSDKLRAVFLGALADGLLRVPNGTQDEAALCRLAPIAAPLLPEFRRLLPQRAAMVTAQITRCQPRLDADARAEVGDAAQEQLPNTVEELLAAAGKTSDPERRVTYLNRAAYKSFGERKYERAVGILDGFSAEERELANRAGGLWDSWRVTFASAAAAADLKRGDRPAMYRVIADTPDRLRANVQLNVASELVKKDAPVALQLIGEARAAIAKAGATQGFGSYLWIVRLYSALNQPDAVPALRDAVKAMNEAEHSGQIPGSVGEAEAQIPLLSNDIMLGFYNLPAALLMMDDVGARQTIGSVDSPTRRTALRLNLLKASLERYRAASPKPSTADQKGQNDATH
jgi:hypothetical protein